MVQPNWGYLFDRPVDHWDGWDSLLINYWRQKSHPFTSVSSGNKKRKQTSLENYKLLKEYYHLEGSERKTHIDDLGILTETVAFIAQHFVSQLFYDYIIEALNNAEKHNIIYKRAFKAAVKFLLDVFDMEDFMFIYRSLINRPKMEEEYISLHNRLFRTKKGNPDRFIALTKAVTKLSARKYLKNVPHLTEYEIGDVLKQHLMHEEYVRWKGGMLSAIKEMKYCYSDVDETQKRWTRKVMKSYVPLKEDAKMQLTLELMKDKCYYVMDALFVEMMRSINITEFVQPDHHSPVNFALNEIFCCIFIAVSGYFSLKTNLLLHSEEVAIFPLICGIFLPCENDVIEVVKIANHERRIQSRRFISLEHILCGLSFTKYAEDAKNMMSICDDEQRHAEFPIYRIYLSADMIAKEKCHDLLTLESLVLAVYYEVNEHHSLSFLGSSKDHKLSEGSNNNECTIAVENLWSPILTEAYKAIDQADTNQALLAAKFFDKKYPTPFIIPDIRRPVDIGH